MKTITFHLTALQPLLLTSLQGDPNSSVSFPYLPGSMLRGALIRQYCQQRGKDLDLDSGDVQRLFFDATTRYLNAYPLVGKIRSVPTPRSLVADKTADWKKDQLDIYDRSVAICKEASRSVAGFIARDQRGNLLHTTTEKLVNIHNQRDRPRGRGVKGAGAVFRYEAISPEQTFGAAIICDNQDVELLKGLLPDRFWIGGSRSAGYGEVRLDAIEVVDSWQEMPQWVVPKADANADNTPQVLSIGPFRLTVTLTSDLVLRAAHGGYTTAPPDTAMSAMLGVPLELDLAHTVLATTLHGSFNRTWGLPVPQMPTLAAGSVLTYTCASLPSEDAITKLETLGLGERRAEGFGRMACNMLPRDVNPTLYRWSPKNEDAQAPVLDAESQQLATLMGQRILAARLEQRLIEQTETHQIKGNISNTQLSRLRIIARRAIGSGSLDSVKRFLDTLPANAREQFARAEVGNQPLNAWIEQHLQPVQTDWNSDYLEVSVAGITPPSDEKTKSDFNLRLLMAMARLKVKGGIDE